MGVFEESSQAPVKMELEEGDWRQGECLVPSLLGRFLDQQQFTDVNFVLADGSSIAAHKLLLAISSSVFEGLFFGPLSDKNLREVKVDDVKPSGFRRLIHFIYNSKCLSWKIDDPEEWWHILEAANKYLNTRLVEQIERRLRDLAKRDASKGVVLRHLNMAVRCGFDSAVKTVLTDFVVKNTSRLISAEEDWLQLDEAAMLKIYNQDFLAATEGELYQGAKQWCLRNSSSEAEALKLFLDKFVQKIVPEYMSQRDFLTYVACDSFLAQVDVFRDWTIKVMVRNAADNTIRGSYRPMRILQFYFNAQQRGNSPTQFKEEVATIDFQNEVTKYTAVITSVWDGDSSGLHFNISSVSTEKALHSNKPLSLVKPGPKSTKSNINLPEMVTDEEAQKYARKSALLVAKMKDGTLRAEVLANLDDYGSGYTSKDLFSGSKSGIEYVQVMVAIDARPNLKVAAISHKQFVEYVGTHGVKEKVDIEKVPFAKEFEFRVDNTNLESAEREICRTLRLKDCQAWYVNENNACKKREPLDSGDLATYLRNDAIHQMINKFTIDVQENKGRAVYTGKGGDDTDRFLLELATMKTKYKSARFWIMLEKEFKDDSDKLVSSVCKYDATTGNLNYCGTICLQMNETATLKPTQEFFAMILYNSDPNSKVYLRRFLSSENVTSVSQSEDIVGIKNFDIFVIQEGAKNPEDKVTDYSTFIVKKINEMPVVFRPKSGAEDRIFTLNVDSTLGINHVKSKLREAMDVPLSAPVSIYECISSEGATANPLKKRSFRRPMEQSIFDEDPRIASELFRHCEDGTNTLYYSL